MKIALFFITILIAVWLLRVSDNLPSLTNIFASKPIVIDETPILIKEIKSIAQLVTVTAYDEVVVDSTIPTRRSSVVNAINALSPVPLLPSVDTRLVLVARGKILAGTNLQNLQKENFTIKEDTIIMRLPKAIILDAILNPSDFEVFEEKGEWTDQAVTAVKIKARQKMIDRAIQRNILGKADVKAKSVMEDLLRNSGYKVATVILE